MTVMKDHERLDLLKEIGGTKVYEERREESLKVMKETDGRRKRIEEVVRSMGILSCRPDKEFLCSHLSPTNACCDQGFDSPEGQTKDESPLVTVQLGNGKCVLLVDGASVSNHGHDCFPSLIKSAATSQASVIACCQTDAQPLLH